MKNISILGSTGSIGVNAVEIVRMFPDKFRVKTLAAGRNVTLLLSQIKELRPEIVAVCGERETAELERMLPSGLNVSVMHGKEGYAAVASHPAVDTVISAIVGSAGLEPTLAAIDAGKTIALANKETLVIAGELVMARAAAQGVDILPVDSEHSAVFQCLRGENRRHLKKILLTASGGPFRTMDSASFADIGPEDALKHPTWNMGRKITIDSATLMNKGLEVIEARWLFDVSADEIDVLVHPQSIVHSMVAFLDGSVMAQMGTPDMKKAIAYAVSYPDRLPVGDSFPDFAGIDSLTFEKPDLEKFPCLKLAYEALRQGKTVPAALNAANEIAVNAFLNHEIPFTAIPVIIKRVMEKHSPREPSSAEAVLAADAAARSEALRLVGQNRKS